MIPFPTWWGRSEHQRSRGTEPGGTECQSGSGPRAADRSCSCKCHDRGGTSSPEDINKGHKRLLLNAEHICCKAADTYRTVYSHCQDVLSIVQQSDRIKQRLPDILAISIPQTRSTELTLNAPTLITAATCLSVHRFLTALMTSRALKSKHNKKIWLPAKTSDDLMNSFFSSIKAPTCHSDFVWVKHSLTTSSPANSFNELFTYVAVKTTENSLWHCCRLCQSCFLQPAESRLLWCPLQDGSCEVCSE